MKPFGFLCLAVSSVLFTVLVQAETRPQYGGTLRMMMQAGPVTLDPADRRSPDSFTRRTVTSLIFDTLVALDEAGRPTPGLAESWQAARGDQHWQFRLRREMKFQDGTPLNSEMVASSLRFANPEWSVRADGDSVIIDSAEPKSNMVAELALSRNAIVKRDGEQKFSGTGPFHIAEWQPGRKLVLVAEEDCWRGRPFVDGIEIEMGRSFRDQATALQVGKTDLIDVAPEQAHHFSAANGILVSSSPVELVALAFSRDFSSAGEKLQREALRLSLDRGSMQSVLLQGTGQSAGSLLPTWISGYGFVFSTKADLPRARELRGQVQTAHVWTVGHDGSNSLARLIVERIALNAKDVGLSMVPTSAGSTDLRLVTIALPSSDPWIALESISAETGLPALQSKGSSIEDLYAAEQADLASDRVVPLFHLPVFYAASTSVRGWRLRADGNLDLTHAWLGAAK